MNINAQVEYLMQGTLYGDDKLKAIMARELRQRLIEAESEGRALRVYCGFDPTTSDLHIGHTVPMRKLCQFQELGHEVIFLVGDYTSTIGDPSGRDDLRPRLTHEQVLENGKTYADQAFKVLDEQKTQVLFNSAWLSELSFAELIGIASSFTMQQFLTRENFRKRFDKGDPIYLHETFYAIMQGYDAYAMNADVQVGGTDQLFNIMTAARKVMTSLGSKPNIAIINDILPGTDGVIKMSKSLGNHIPMLAEPPDMYGKVMSVPDAAMPFYYRLVTRWKPEEIQAMETGVSSGEMHPRDAKMKLACEIVSIYHDEAAAQEAEAHFVQVFRQGQVPDDMPEYTLEAGKTLLDILADNGLVGSRGDGRRMIQQNAVKLDGQVLNDPFAEGVGPGVLQVGKRRYLRVLAD